MAKNKTTNADNTTNSASEQNMNTTAGGFGKNSTNCHTTSKNRATNAKNSAKAKNSAEDCNY